MKGQGTARVKAKRTLAARKLEGNVQSAEPGGWGGAVDLER